MRNIPNKDTEKIERHKFIILTIIGLLIIVAFSLALNRSATFNRLYSDLFLRWHATTKLLSEGRNLYDPKNAEEMWQISYGRNPWGYETNFFYPAHLLIFTAPLALLTYQSAHLIWTIVIQLFYIASLLLAMRTHRWPSNSNSIAFFIGVSIIFLPYIFHTIWGQFNTIGMFGLVLCYLALREERYALAGALAISLTFKPQNDLLTLIFLLFWSLWQKKRWPFILSFGVVSLFCWLFAELFQPGWVLAFVASLGHYTTIQSAVDMMGNPHQILTILLVLFSFGVFFWKKQVSPKSTAFIGCLMLSMAVWALIVPIFGWIQSVFLMVAVVWLIPLWRTHLQPFRNYPIYIFIFLYIFGWLGFFMSAFTGGDPTEWTEIAYKVLFPLSILLLSIPICWQKESLG